MPSQVKSVYSHGFSNNKKYFNNQGITIDPINRLFSNHD